MESEKNIIYEKENKTSKEKNKPIAVHKQYLDGTKWISIGFNWGTKSFII